MKHPVILACIGYVSLLPFLPLSPYPLMRTISPSSFSSSCCIQRHGCKNSIPPLPFARFAPENELHYGISYQHRTHTHVLPLLFHPKRNCANASSFAAAAAADGKTECAGKEEGTHHHLLYFFPYPSSSFAYQTPFGVQSQSNQPNSQPTAGGGPLLGRGGNCFLNTGEGRDGRSKDTLATG